MSNEELMTTAVSVRRKCMVDGSEAVWKAAETGA